MIEDHQIVKQLRGIAARLTSDLDLQKDLIQEMFIHLVQAEADRPGQTLSWYLQGCHFRARDYLDRGRSINSVKRSNNLVPLDQRDDDDDSLGICPDAPDPVDLHSELITRDIVDLLVPQLTDMQQQILFLLMHGFGVCEIARELRVSVPTFIKHRKRIARTAAALLADSAGIISRNAFSDRSLVHTTRPPFSPDGKRSAKVSHGGNTQYRRHGLSAQSDVVQNKPAFGVRWMALPTDKGRVAVRKLARATVAPQSGVPHADTTQH